MKKFKLIVTIAIVFALVLSMTACGNNPVVTPSVTPSAAPTTSPTQTTTPVATKSLRIDASNAPQSFKNYDYFSSKGINVYLVENGTEKLLSASEYTIDSAAYLRGKAGKYTIKVTLKADTSIFASYEVEVAASSSSSSGSYLPLETKISVADFEALGYSATPVTVSIEDITSTGNVSITNNNFNGTVKFGKITATGKTITIVAPNATVNLNGTVTSTSITVTASTHTTNINANIDAALIVALGNLVIETGTIQRVEIPVENTTISQIMVKGGTVALVETKKPVTVTTLATTPIAIKPTANVPVIVESVKALVQLDLTNLTSSSITLKPAETAPKAQITSGNVAQVTVEVAPESVKEATDLIEIPAANAGGVTGSISSSNVKKVTEITYAVPFYATDAAYRAAVGNDVANIVAYSPATAMNFNVANVTQTQLDTWLTAYNAQSASEHTTLPYTYYIKVPELSTGTVINEAYLYKNGIKFAEDREHLLASGWATQTAYGLFMKLDVVFAKKIAGVWETNKADCAIEFVTAAKNTYRLNLVKDMSAFSIVPKDTATVANFDDLKAAVENPVIKTINVKGALSITDDITLPSNKTIVVEGENSYSVASGKTFTVNGTFKDLRAAGVMAGDGTLEYVYGAKGFLGEDEFIGATGKVVLSSDGKIALTKDGGMSLTAGKATIAKDIGFNNGQIITIAANTTLEVPSTTTITDGGATWTVNGNYIQGVTTYEQLTAALSNANVKTIKVEKDITLNDSQAVTREVVLDLNGKTINTATEKAIKISEAGFLTVKDSGTNGKIATSEDYMFYLYKGKLVLSDGLYTSTGTWGDDNEYGTEFIHILGSTSSTAENYSVLEIGEDAKLQYVGNGIGAYGFNIGQTSNAAYGVKVDVYGDIDVGKDGDALYINGTVNKTTGNVPEIVVHDKAEVVGIVYAAGFAKWTFEDGCKVTGDMALSVKAGEFNITGGEFIAEGSYYDPATSNNNGTEDTGAAFSITNNTAYAGNMKINVTGGSFTSKNGYALYEGTAYDTSGSPITTEQLIDTLSITGGTFTSEGGKDAIKTQHFNALYKDGKWTTLSQIAANETLTLSTSDKLTINGTFTNNGTLVNNGTATNNGTVAGSGSITGTGTFVGFTWSQLADTSWYNGTDTSFDIENACELAGLAKLVNAGSTFSGKTINLTKSIDLQGLEWTPIANATRSGKSVASGSYVFAGEFNGNNNTINKLTIGSVSGSSTAGLFGAVSGTVKNIKLNNVDIDANECVNVGSVSGLVLNGGTIDHCEVNGTVQSKEVGGVVGRILVEGSITNCTNNAAVSGSLNAAGIVCKAYYTEAANKEMNVTNCVNNGVVVATGYHAGGIVMLSAANVTNCTNNATVTASGSSAGGSSAGGIVGEQTNYGVISGCKNNAEIKGLVNAGGIVGWIRYINNSSDYVRNMTIEVLNNENTKNVSTTGTSDVLGAGGIVGTVYNVAVVSGNTNKNCAITGTNFAAGIVGNYQKEINNLYSDRILSMSNNTVSSQTITGPCKDDIVYDNLGYVIFDNVIEVNSSLTISGISMLTIPESVMVNITATGTRSQFQAA